MTRMDDLGEEYQLRESLAFIHSDSVSAVPSACPTGRRFVITGSLDRTV